MTDPTPELYEAAHEALRSVVGAEVPKIVDMTWAVAHAAGLAEGRRQMSAAIVEALCSQALADHLGDVRDAERHLWDALGVSRAVRVRDHDSAWRNTRETLRAAGIPLPAHLEEDDKDDDD